MPEIQRQTTVAVTNPPIVVCAAKPGSPAPVYGPSADRIKHLGAKDEQCVEPGHICGRATKAPFPGSGPKGNTREGHQVMLAAVERPYDR